MSQPVQSNPPRVRVFIDFWNYTLSMKGADADHRTNWSKIGKVIADEAARVVGQDGGCAYQGTNVYLSYDQSKEADKKLKSWAMNTLDKFPGVYVYMAERQRKKGWPSCPVCHNAIQNCPSCKSDMRGTEEKGIDTRIVTDMLSLAWANNYDVAVIVSADRDFVPAAEFLQTKGLKVVHGAFPPMGAILMQKCWGSLDIPKLRSLFER
jgi:uncharacterized LabA/DUF88 family protein